MPKLTGILIKEMYNKDQEFPFLKKGNPFLNISKKN